MTEDVQMNQVFTLLLGSVQKGCLLFIPMLLVLRTGLSTVKGFLDPSVKVHYQPLFNGIMVWVVIATYPEIMRYFDMLCRTLIDFVAPPVADPVLAIGAAIMGRQRLSGIHTAGEMSVAMNELFYGNVIKGTQDVLSTARDAVIKTVTETGEDWIAGLVSIFASIARMMIETIRAVFLKFLIAVGPIAITFSLADGFAHVARYWLQKLLSVYCWALTLNILDTVIISYYTAASVVPVVSQFKGTPVKAQTPYFMDELIVGAMYLIVPWLTSTYLGGMDAGHFLNNKLSVVSTLFTSVISSAKSLIAPKS